MFNFYSFVLAVGLLVVKCGDLRAASSVYLFETGPFRTQLIELFTSEGCSSCPPAEQWLNSLQNSPELWKRFIPIQFHVDYWDYLGWIDKYGSRQFSIRQRFYAQKWGASTVYTPGFVLDGREWTHSEYLPDFSAEKVGTLKVKKISSEEYVVEFDPADPVILEWELHYSLLGMGFQSQVTAGENRGKRLTHDFVALGVSRKKMEAQSTHFTALIKPENDSPLIPKRYALVVWVTRADDLIPIQSTGGFIH